ncbi:hypothetical protein, partial [Burkholderia stabilis]
APPRMTAAIGPRAPREGVQRRTHEDTISADHRLTPRFRATHRIAAPAGAVQSRAKPGRRRLLPAAAQRVSRVRGFTLCCRPTQSTPSEGT